MWNKYLIKNNTYINPYMLMKNKKRMECIGYKQREFSGIGI